MPYWSEYDAALSKRGSPTLWFTEQVSVSWRVERRIKWGGQPHHLALAIATALTLPAVFLSALR
jgi:hypothetical protein